VPDELLTIFKVCFLVLLYLFFFRVLRAVWTEVNAAPAGAEPLTPTKAPKAPKPAKRVKAKKSEPAPAPPPEPEGPSRLVAVDPPHLAGIEYALTDGMTVGRGSDATLVLDDNFLSSRHASFHLRDDDWVVEDLGSTNGSYVNNVKVDRISRLHTGDRVQVGNVMFEVL
jgi:hypothetical protein